MKVKNARRNSVERSEGARKRTQGQKNRNRKKARKEVGPPAGVRREKSENDGGGGGATKEARIRLVEGRRKEN